MLPFGALFTLACVCAVAADVKTDLLNNTNIDKRVLKRLATILESNKTLDRRDIALLNRTAHFLDIDDYLVNKFMDLLRENETVDSRVLISTPSTPSVLAYDDSVKKKVEKAETVEESPDYGSSVVLASDLLSLTSAIARVKNDACREQGYKFLDGLLMNKRWALKMFDASAKSPQGLLFGSSYHLGNFDECVGIDSGDDGIPVEGQYCLASIKWKQTEAVKTIRTGRGESLRWAVCVPSACDAKTVATFVDDVVINTIGNSTATGVAITARDCYKKHPITVSRLDIGYLSLILLFVAILFFSTLYEVYIIKSGHGHKESVIHDLIISFSVINNIRKILTTRQHNALGLECVTGIKSLAMVFIIAGHACLFIGSGPVMDAEAWDRLVRDPTSAFMLSNALLVDTFLMLSAFLFSRLLLLELDKRRGKLNVLPILIFRYIRITPAYAVVILFYMTWLPKIGDGPLWENRLLLEQERCRASWWTNILYINNYVNTDQLCMFQSWYLSVDTQLFYIAPIFIYSLWRWRKVGPTFLAIGTFISLLIPSIITYRDRLDATILFYAKEFTDITANKYFKEAYIKTHMKMTPYFMGLLTGHILHRIQTENYQLSKFVKITGWSVSIVLGTVTTFSVSLFYQEWYQYSVIEAAFYISLHKLAWGIANGWLIIACATGNGGIFHKLLTWRFLVPISRLTYCAYLVNGIVELYYVGQLRHPLHVTFFTVLANSVSHLVLTFVLALMLCVTFESPIHGIEKILLRRFARPVLSDNARRQESPESSRNTSQSKLDT